MFTQITAALVAVGFISTAIAQSSQAQPISDPGTYGPEVEIVHLYYDEWPTGSSFRWYITSH